MQKYKATLIGLSLLFLSQFALAQEFGTLVLGSPTPINSPVSKAMILLRFNGATCSGVAISAQHVLTAGHCFDSKPATSAIKVYSGSNKSLQPSVGSYTLHPRYGQQGQRLIGDLAIIKMARSFGGAVVPAPIFQSSIPSGTQILAAGFGYSKADQSRIRELYQAVYVWGQNAAFDPQPFSDGTRLIEYTSRQALCKGDSGGATFVNTTTGLRTVGIHSLANCFDLGYDVFVPDHRTWIKKHSQ